MVGAVVLNVAVAPQAEPVDDSNNVADRTAATMRRQAPLSVLNDLRAIGELRSLFMEHKTFNVFVCPGTDAIDCEMAIGNPMTERRDRGANRVRAWGST